LARQESQTKAVDDTAGYCHEQWQHMGVTTSWSLAKNYRPTGY